MSEHAETHGRGAKSTPGRGFGPSTSAFEQVIRDGGVVLFPSDTVYGLACDPENPQAIKRLYELKGRPDDKSAAVMFFDLQAGLQAFRGVGAQTHAALHGLLPGKVTVLLANPSHRFPLACRADPETIGLRVISVAQLAGVKIPVLQSSANRSGNADARRLEDIDTTIREGADLVIDGGELPGTASTVVDLRGYEDGHTWAVVRRGAVDEDALAAALGGRFMFDPASYAEMVVDTLPGYARLHSELVAASGEGARTILDLGIGTGEAAVRLLERHPQATFVGVDESPAMLAAAAGRLGDRLVASQVSLLQDPLPAARFDLVVSALAIHHLDDREKADLFARLRSVVASGGSFVLADVVVPEDPTVGLIELTAGYDKPSSVADQLGWLRDAGFEASTAWSENDLVVIVARAA